MDIFGAAAAGDLEQVHRELARALGLGVNIVDCADEAGRTACFYAQLRGHEHIAALLAARGWTAMDSSSLFTTSGGRVCFWHEPKLPRRLRPVPALMRSATAVVDTRGAPPARVESLKKAPARVASLKKARVAERRAARAAGHTVRARAARLLYVPSAPRAAKANASLRPYLVADDMPELGLITRVPVGKAMASRLKTGASAIVTSAWRASSPCSSQYGVSIESECEPASSETECDLDCDSDCASPTWPLRQISAPPDDCDSDAAWVLVGGTSGDDDHAPCESISEAGSRASSEAEWELIP
jgi:hypothetical protein